MIVLSPTLPPRLSDTNLSGIWVVARRSEYQVTLKIKSGHILAYTLLPFLQHYLKNEIPGNICYLVRTGMSSQNTGTTYLVDPNYYQVQDIPRIFLCWGGEFSVLLAPGAGLYYGRSITAASGEAYRIALHCMTR